MTNFIDFEFDIDNFDDTLLDFSQNVEEKSNIISEQSNVIEYDKDTTEKYKAMRFRKMDPISLCDIDDKYAFKFKYKWDPYTGERQGEDPDGPLCFDPDMLIKYYHTKRFDKLWINPIDDNNGYYQGYYDDGVGCGDDFYLPARGSHPEWYIFRIPIMDCYLTKDHNYQFITFGPKLTDEEITLIDKLANLRSNNYKKLFGHTRPSLTSMKKLYDQAITKEPYIENKQEIAVERLQENYNKINREAVNDLVKIKG